MGSRNGRPGSRKAFRFIFALFTAAIVTGIFVPQTARLGTDVERSSPADHLADKAAIETAACVTSVTPLENVVHWRGDEGTISVSAPAGCGWLATFGAPWITSIGRANGIGNGTISYKAEGNLSSSLRQAAITIDGIEHRVYQSREGQSQCRLVFGSSMINVPAEGAAGTITFTAGSECAWSAQSNVPWITLSGDLINTGSGSVAYSIQPTNLTSPRQGIVNFGNGVGTVRFTQAAATGLSANAGPDLTVVLPSVGQLAGQTNGGSGAVSVVWSQVSGPSTVIFSSSTALNTQAIFNRAGIYQLRLTATDGILVATDDVTVTVGSDPLPPPPDPATIAPAVRPNTATNLSDATKFLYSGPDAIQTGVAEGTIKPERVGLIRGRVIDRGGQPIPNVTITINDHPELGQTRTRTDGKFDMVVNAGGEIVVKYERQGFISSQREEKIDWQTYEGFDDVVLLPYDPNVTIVNSNSTVIQVAAGSLNTDGVGSRRSVLFFKPGTVGSMELADGTLQPIPVMNVRITEFTVGEKGPQAMPAELPPTSEYTFAAEYSVDEAVAANARSVRFDRPVIQYLENFIGFPVGASVPSGTYDRVTAEWTPDPSGKVIQIVSITAGVANLDIVGNGRATDEEYASLGIDLAERQKLAQLYPVGQSLWRVPLGHFSPKDYNYPMLLKPPPDAAPPFAEPTPKEVCDEEVDIECTTEIQTQTVTETIEITQTGLEISYKSSQQQDSQNMGAVIPLTGPSPDPDVEAVAATVRIAGRRIDTELFSPTPNRVTTFTWDGRDGFGRPVQGSQTARIEVFHLYPLRYTLGDEFGQPGNGSGQAVSTTNGGYTVRGYDIQLGGFDHGRTGLGGWSFNVHHAYNPTTRTLVEGTGKIRSADGIDKSVTTPVGLGIDDAGFSGDGGPAVEARLNAPSDVAFAPNGDYFIADTLNNRVRRVSANGIITTFAGDGNECDPAAPCGDGGPAASAQLFEPRGVAVDPDGCVLISDSGSNRIRKVAPNGVISTLAGTGAACDPLQACGDGGPASQASFNKPGKIHLAVDGSLYVADTDSNRVRKISTNGNIRTIAGNGRAECPSDNVPALTACIESPTSTALAPNGSLFITANAPDHSQIVRLDTDGLVHKLADGICNGARPAGLRSICNSMGVAIGPDGIPYVASSGENRIYKYDIDGEWKDLVGSGSNVPNGDGQPDLAANLGEPMSVTFAPNGDLFIATSFHNQVRRSASPLPGYSDGDLLIASEDGSEVFQFDADGQHQRTLNALTGTPKYIFAYDNQGNLTSITDGDNNVTTIERDGGGKPTGIRSPYGQLTALAVDPNGYLTSVTNPAGETYRYTYTSGGLMLTRRDPRGAQHTFTYDQQGRLVRDEDAAGDERNFTRTGEPNDFTVTRTSPSNRTSTFRVQVSPERKETQDITFDDGSQFHIETQTDGSSSEIDADGTTSSTTRGPDPRWGMQAPLEPNSEVRTPAGRTLTLTQTRTIALIDPADPVAIAEQHDVLGKNGRNYLIDYTAANRTFAYRSPLNRTSSLVIDLQERLTQLQTTGINPLDFTYDSRGRLSTFSFGTGAEARTFTNTYNTDGFLSQRTDPFNRTTGFQYDAVGRTTQISLADNRMIGFGYDANGNLTSVTPPGRPAHTLAYNERNLLASYTAPNLGGNRTTAYEYNADLDLTRITRPDSLQINYTYNALGQLQTKTTPTGPYGYTYNSQSGQLAGITAPGGITNSFQYDGFLVTQAATTGAAPGSVSYTYNNDLLVSSVSVNGATPIGYTYDNDSLLIGAGGMTLNRSPQNGLLTGTALGNVTDTITYNTFGEPAVYDAKFNATSVYNAQNTYDKLGRIIRKIETIGGTVTTYDYGYDTTGRLTTVALNGAPQPMVTYTYDPNDNRTSVNLSGVVTNATYDAQDRLMTYGAAAYTYTANGDLQTKTTGGNTTTYNYDVLGNLRSVTLPGGTQIEYVIDGLDRRIGKRVNGTLTQGFLYQDDLQIAAELDAAGAIVSRFVYANRSNVPDFMLKNGQIYRLIHDQVGSVRLVIDISSGTIAQRIDYDEFGVVMQDTNPGFQPFGFAGGLYDQHTKLTRFGARDYDAEVGRWTCKDPILFDGGYSNFYGYVGMDPINSIDPSGKGGITDIITALINGPGDVAYVAQLKHIELLEAYSRDLVRQIKELRRRMKCAKDYWTKVLLHIDIIVKQNQILEITQKLNEARANANNWAKQHGVPTPFPNPNQSIQDVYKQSRY